MTKTYNPPASESGYQKGDKVWVLNYSNQFQEEAERYRGVVVDVLETYIRVKYQNNRNDNVYRFNRYLPTRLEPRNEAENG